MPVNCCINIRLLWSWLVVRLLVGFVVVASLGNFCKSQILQELATTKLFAFGYKYIVVFVEARCQYLVDVLRKILYVWLAQLEQLFCFCDECKFSLRELIKIW